MIKTTRVGNTVVCFLNGTMYQRTFENEKELISLYELIMKTNEYDDDEIEILKTALIPPKTDSEIKLEFEFEKKQNLFKNQEKLDNWMKEIREEGYDEEFRVDGLELYMKGINIPIPQFLAMEFAKERNKDSLLNLKNFWRLLALNPDTHCREDLYGFLQKNKLSITPSGCFLAYRNVKTKQKGNKELNEFISKEWAKVLSWQLSPKDYSIYQKRESVDVEGTVSTKYYTVPNSSKFKNSVGSDEQQITYISDDGEELKYTIYNAAPSDADPHRGEIFVANLHDAYTGLSDPNTNQTIYTDGHSGQMRINIGTPVSMPREQTDRNRKHTCSRGLHAANSDWLKSGYFGDTGLAILINPMNVVACPYSDSGKLRCCEYMPVAIIDFNEEGDVIPFDATTIDIEYAEYTQEQLDNLITESTFSSFEKQEIISADINFDEFIDIVENLDKALSEMTAVVNNRIKDV